MDWPPIGTRLTPKQETKAYYSGYGGNPPTSLRPGEVAIVAQVDIPPVTGKKSNFLTAQFTRHSIVQTVALRPGEYTILPPSTDAV